MTEKVVIGDCTLFRADCRDVLPMLGRFDLLLTDPPYGIGAAKNRNSQKWGWTDFGVTGWDSERPSDELMATCRGAAKKAVIWGGNYFADQLPASMCWFVWDKGQREFSLADCELAWVSEQRAARVLTYPRSLALQDGKQHQTQKPIALMAWCLRQFEDCDVVLDPFMGSGTTGVACVQLGRKFTGIEREPKYFDIACKRIEQAYAQGVLIPHEQPKPVQETLI